MAGLSINYNNGIFKYLFNQSSISEIKIINGVKMPTLLERALSGDLPKKVRDKIKEMNKAMN
ncbi:MAG TPA: hypothetical protein VIM70_00145 [Clostridium sp.]|uniref:hypothetical protein n=1 Tax=Clostridium sp. TaxID=1506 RepID=UPI002F948983